MLSTFQITKALFQNQIHERFSFSVNCGGNDYQGLYYEGRINWFNPQPSTKLDGKQLKQIESSITKKMHQFLS
ncbi:hypothetical protein MKY34_06505 [Sporosarcina sp. FSL K6-1522]|uniref:hypothetical protein n=1 Tax=Sporosarcina sp. FSL K6-1522 TaxID=2921554 RepID=UPI00315A7FA5